MKKIFAVLFAAFLIAFGNTAFADVPVGQAMPEVSYISIDGSQIQTADLLKDKDAVLIYFFRLGCPSCAEEFPVLNELMEEYGSQAAFLALDAGRHDSAAELRRMRDQNAITFPVAPEGDWVLSELLPYETFPCTIVLDRNNQLVFYQDYALASAKDLKEVFDTILAKEYEGGFEMVLSRDSLPEDPEAAPQTPAGYRIAIRDQNGEPVPDVMINFCSDAQQTCRIGAADKDGEIFFKVPEDTYHISILASPEGYTYDTDFELYTKNEYGSPISIMITKE